MQQLVPFNFGKPRSVGTVQLCITIAGRFIAWVCLSDHNNQPLEYGIILYIERIPTGYTFRLAPGHRSALFRDTSTRGEVPVLYRWQNRITPMPYPYREPQFNGPPIPIWDPAFHSRPLHVAGYAPPWRFRIVKHDPHCFLAAVDRRGVPLRSGFLLRFIPGNGVQPCDNINQSIAVLTDPGSRTATIFRNA